eukprot:Em0001g3303a
MVKNQLLWMKKILFPGIEKIQFPGIEKIQENIQFPRMQFPENIQFLGMQFPEKIQQLWHPNIITLMGISSNKSELLIVMNLVNGFNVDQVIFKQALPLDTNTVRSIAVQITKALTYMHGRSPRVIHHDIKPSNIMPEAVYAPDDSRHSYQLPAYTGPT